MYIVVSLECTKSPLFIKVYYKINLLLALKVWFVLKVHSALKEHPAIKVNFALYVNFALKLHSVLQLHCGPKVQLHKICTAQRK